MPSLLLTVRIAIILFMLMMLLVWSVVALSLRLASPGLLNVNMAILGRNIGFWLPRSFCRLYCWGLHFGCI